MTISLRVGAIGLVVALACRPPLVNADLVPEITPPGNAATRSAVDTLRKQASYPPAAVELFLPPQPIPGDVRGFRLIAEFDVSPVGDARLTGMSRSRNQRYNARLQSELLKLRFRPGTTADGTPARAVATLIYDF